MMAGSALGALLASHITGGRELEARGLLREAIAEYSREHSRPIASPIDAEIAQSSYWHVGMVHRRTGELEEAVKAFQAARELLERHGVGVHPHNDLAEVLIELGRLDDAIRVCEEELKLMDNWATRQLLARAAAMKRAASDIDGA